MRWIRGLVLLTLLAAMATTGCGPNIPENELGKIEYQMPRVPGAEQPYPIPPPAATSGEESAPSETKDLPLPSSDDAVTGPSEESKQ